MVGGLPETIPICPLPSASLFPNASHAFRIYEPRYRTMVVEAMKGNRIIGMTTLRPGFEADCEGRPSSFAVSSLNASRRVCPPACTDGSKSMGLK